LDYLEIVLQVLKKYSCTRTFIITVSARVHIHFYLLSFKT